jgi:hypothetical protein
MVVVLARSQCVCSGETAGRLSGKDRPPSLAYRGNVAERGEDNRGTDGTASPGSLAGETARGESLRGASFLIRN